MQNNEQQVNVGTRLANRTLGGMFMELVEIKDFLASTEVNGEDRDALEDLILVGEAALAGKIDRIAMLLEGLDNYELRLKDAMERNKKKVASIKAMVKKTLELAPNATLKGIAYQAQLVNNGGQAPLDIDPDLLPSDYIDEIIEIKRKPRQALIRTDLEAGKTIPGVVARERGQHVRIKPL